MKSSIFNPEVQLTDLYCLFVKECCLTYSFSGTRGESGGQTGVTYDISNKHRLGYSEVQLVQKMIDGVNTLVKEDKELQKKHGL